MPYQKYDIIHFNGQEEISFLHFFFYNINPYIKPDLLVLFPYWISQFSPFPTQFSVHPTQLPVWGAHVSEEPKYIGGAKFA